jgi:uncharacterized protein YciI
MFIVLATKLRDWAQDDPVALAHHARMRDECQKGSFLCSGVRKDGQGGILIGYGDDEAKLRELLDDEFIRQGYMGLELIELTLANVDPRSNLTSEALWGS